MPLGPSLQQGHWLLGSKEHLSTRQGQLMKILIFRDVAEQISTAVLFPCNRLGLVCQFALLVFPAWHHRVGVCGLPRSYTRTPSHSCTRNFLFCGCPAVSTILLLAGVAFPPHLSQTHKADAVQIFLRLLHCYYFSAAVHGRCAVAECQLPFSMNSHTSYEQWELVV